MLPVYRGFLHGAAGFFAVLGRVIRCGERTYTSFIVFWLSFFGIFFVHIFNFRVLEEHGVTPWILYFSCFAASLSYVPRFIDWATMGFFRRSRTSWFILFMKLLSACILMAYYQYGTRYTREFAVSAAALIVGKNCGKLITQSVISRRFFLCYYTYHVDIEDFSDAPDVGITVGILTIFRCIGCGDSSGFSDRDVKRIMHELGFGFGRGDSDRCLPHYYLTKSWRGNYFALRTSIMMFESDLHAEVPIGDLLRRAVCYYYA